MRKSLLLLFVMVAVVPSLAMAGQCGDVVESPRGGSESVGANETVVFSTIHKVRTIEGSVIAATDTPLPNGIVDVYKANRYSKNATDAIPDSKLIGSFKVDEQGRFCLSALEDGLYILRIGTNEFAFKHQLIWVRKEKAFKKQSLTIRLEPGT